MDNIAEEVAKIEHEKLDEEGNYIQQDLIYKNLHFGLKVKCFGIFPK